MPSPRIKNKTNGRKNMKSKKLFALLLSLALVFSLCACTQNGGSDATEAPTEDPALALYAQAADALEAAADLQRRTFTAGTLTARNASFRTRWSSRRCAPASAP